MRTSWFFVAAIAFAFAAAGVIYLRLAGADRSAQHIVFAIRPIAAGEAIRAEQVNEVNWGASSVPPGSFTSRKAVIGRVALVAIPAQRPLFEADLASAGAVPGLEALISKGTRAVSLDANTVSGIGSYIRSGSLVDVIVAGRDQADQPFSKIVVQRVRVLSVEAPTKSDGTPEKPQAITLQLNPAQAEQLDLSRSIGKLSVVLRNNFDEAAIQSRGARMPDLMTGTPVARVAVGAAPEPTAPAAPASPRRERTAERAPAVEQIRGTGQQAQMP